MNIETSRNYFSTVAVVHFLQFLMLHYLFGIVPSLAIGVAAFGAGELLLNNNKKELSLKESDRNLYDILQIAKLQNKEILNMVSNIEDYDMKRDLNEIHQTVEKIISAVTKKPNKKKKVEHFFDYYLPVTIKILHRYDEIENQGLKSEDGKKFMLNAQKMISEINVAFEKQLNSLYQSDIVDADAEMKVFDAMLKADGFDANDFNM